MEMWHGFECEGGAPKRSTTPMWMAAVFEPKTEAANVCWLTIPFFVDKRPDWAVLVVDVDDVECLSRSEGYFVHIDGHTFVAAYLSAFQAEMARE